MQPFGESCVPPLPFAALKSLGPQESPWRGEGIRCYQVSQLGRESKSLAEEGLEGEMLIVTSWVLP